MRRRLAVNQYGWINIWTAILGYSLSGLPAFFQQWGYLVAPEVANFPDRIRTSHILILHFLRAGCIKRRCLAPDVTGQAAGASAVTASH